MTDRRLLLVHAHPDDETLGTGVTMAKYAAEGAKVTLVTCTLGEEGEVIGFSQSGGKARAFSTIELYISSGPEPAAEPKASEKPKSGEPEESKPPGESEPR